MPRRDLLVAAGILRDKQGRILLVGNDWQGAGRVRFTLPGGMVEAGETAPEALYREIHEETGLRITAIQHMAYCVHIEDERRGERAIAIVFEARWDGLLNPADPDGFIVEARFCTPAEVQQKLDSPPQREPLTDYLATGVPGRFYAFKGWDGKGGLRIPGLSQQQPT
ncbi:NUDIX hydrolase [Deinococcus peraridilitoris]|uniref:ADP-ribose pyrophosphatase n=1 Tax=Deinococcus peraridilitoris (strain DSM 19664 / LMG 22246 / CIP 109416 / KR-200) TaxID=937777 RepID=K9ZXY0_DEIPD|nr:NUDIX hydrolase [Deinococcus peraridilitoris]AFZ65777.1 ADP-ribose pyrophosphatase [Deinococcus peraridilitoris DSM 19664]